VQEANSKVIDKTRPDKLLTTSEPKGKAVVNLVGDIKQELKKVEWTSKEELQVYTKIVLASTFLFGLAIYVIDLAIQGVLGGINLLLKALIG
jgi:preprotein translocase subunit SecE